MALLGSGVALVDGLVDDDRVATSSAAEFDKEWVVEDAGAVGAGLGVDLEKRDDEAADVGVEVLAERDALLGDDVADLRELRFGEWRLEVSHFEKENAEGPHVNLHILCALLENFGRHVLVCAAESAADVGEGGGGAEIRELRLELVGDKNILRLDVAVHEALRVEVLKRLDHLVVNFEHVELP